MTIFEKDQTFEKASFALSCGGTRCQFFTRENILLSQYSIDFIKNQTSVDFTPNGYLMLFGEDQQEDYRHSTELQQELGATTKTATPDQHLSMGLHLPPGQHSSFIPERESLLDILPAVRAFCIEKSP